jgi:N-acetylglucosaminyldiphosphoundecaprenol N-acetyl-beta-D-mannosaminyltransferase
MEDALTTISTWIDRCQPNYVCCIPAHTVINCYDHPELRDVFESSGLNTPDGMAIVWLLRQAGFQQVERVYGPDLLLAACQRGLTPGWKHYFYGGAPEVVSALVEILSFRYPGLKIAGYESPPYRELTSVEEAKMIARIQAAKPDILWVGLGSPKQEIWMHDHLSALQVPVLIGVGAAFDFLAGSKPQAPLWMQRSGLEWFYRLVSEPRRLWKRYILGYPRFVFLVLLQRLGLLHIPPT